MDPAPAASAPELLLDQSPYCAWLLKSNLEFYAVYGNAAPLLGRPAGELAGVNLAGILSEPACASWIRRVGRVFAGETLWLREAFGAASAACSITLFPVRRQTGTIAFAGGIAQQAAESDLAGCLRQAQETERARLSKLLHDRIGQYLSAAGLQLDLLCMDLEDSGFPISQRTAEIQHLLETVMEVVRGFSQELHPVAIERIGLRAALDGLAGRLRSAFQGNVRVLADPAAHPSSVTAAALYRIAEEATANAARHSGCSAIEILLKSTRSGPALEIRDNGQGFDAEGGTVSGRGAGLWVMEQYADQAGIDLHIESAPDKGTVVRAICRTAEKTGAE